MVYPDWMNKRRKSFAQTNTKPFVETFTTYYLERGWPMWMNKGYRTYVAIYIPQTGSGAGATIVSRDKPIPKVKVKRIIIDDTYENINIKVIKVVDLSINGGN